MGGVVSDVRRIVNDIPDPKVRYTNGFLIGILNIVQRDIVNQTWCLQTMTGVTLQTGTTYYSLPTNMLAINQVDYTDSTNRTTELIEVSEKALRQENPDHERTAGKPTNYFVRYSTYQAVTLQIGFYPAPATSASTGTVRVRYYHQAATLNDDDDQIPLDGYRILIPYHDLLTYGAVAKIKMMEGDTAGASFYSQLYLSGIAVMKDRFERMPNYGPGFSGSSK